MRKNEGILPQYQSTQTATFTISLASEHDEKPSQGQKKTVTLYDSACRECSDGGHDACDIRFEVCVHADKCFEENEGHPDDECVECGPNGLWKSVGGAAKSKVFNSRI